MDTSGGLEPLTRCFADSVPNPSASLVIIVLGTKRPKVIEMVDRVRLELTELRRCKLLLGSLPTAHIGTACRLRSDHSTGESRASSPDEYAA